MKKVFKTSHGAYVDFSSLTFIGIEARKTRFLVYGFVGSSNSSIELFICDSEASARLLLEKIFLRYPDDFFSLDDFKTEAGSESVF
jgi:hypothetical protein